MTKEAIKKEFHELIDKVENILILEQFFNALNFSQNNSKAELWDSLTDSERNDIILAFNESEDENNLISFEETKNKYNKWLSK